MKEHFLTLLRQSGTSTLQFRDASTSLTRLLLAEAMNHLPLQSLEIFTPLALAKGAHMTQRIILIPILRAGLAMLPAAIEFLPESPIGFFGIRRNEQTATPHLYYQNLPHISAKDWIFLLDPMLATGGSTLLALEKLQEAGASTNQTILISILASQEGVDALHKSFPKTRLIVTAIDPSLNAKKFIVPGLGDFGDRFFDTSN